MKKVIIPICLVVLMLLGVYGVLQAGKNTKSDTEEYLYMAEKMESEGYYRDAMSYYEKIIEANGASKEMEKKITILSCHLTNETTAVTKTSTFTSTYGEDPEVYAGLVSYYNSKGRKAEAVQTLRTALTAFPNDASLLTLFDTLKGEYKEDYTVYDDMEEEKEGYRYVVRDEQRFLLDSYERELSSNIEYESLDDFSVVNEGGKNRIIYSLKIDDQSVFVDESGAKRFMPGVKFDTVYCFRGDYALVKLNDKYSYINKEGERVGEWYDQATHFSNGIAAVKLGNKWQFISDDGFKLLSDNEYIDVTVNSYNECATAGVMFAKEKDGYVLLDLTGKKLSRAYDEVKPFINNEGFAAVKSQGKWGAVDKEGKEVLPCAYEELTSSVSDLLGFKEKNLWGYMDVKGTVYIAPEFEMVYSMNKTGESYVMRNDHLKKIQLLYFAE